MVGAGLVEGSVRGMTASAVLARHHARRHRPSGYREVDLEIRNGRGVKFHYVIGHAWHAEEAECRSLFSLFSPEPIAGTSLLLIERPGVETVEIFLRFAGGGPANDVDPCYAGDPVLGTDFSYEDLRYWLPFGDLEDHTVTPYYTASDAWVIEGFRVSRYRSRHRVRVVLDSSTWDRLGVQLLSHDGAVRRDLAVSSTTRDGANAGAERIMLRDVERGYESELREHYANYTVIPDRRLLDRAVPIDEITVAMHRWRRESRAAPR